MDAISEAGCGHTPQVEICLHAMLNDSCLSEERYSITEEDNMGRLNTLFNHIVTQHTLLLSKHQHAHVTCPVDALSCCCPKLLLLHGQKPHTFFHPK